MPLKLRRPAGGARGVIMLRSRGAQRNLAAVVGRIIGMHLFDHRWSV